MGTETKLPQLKMKILNLSHLEELQVPAGFQCRHYREGDQEIWNEVIDLSFERKKGQSNFAKEMAGDQHFRPERVWFILADDGRGAATASCWASQDAKQGVVHMVGAHPSFTGKKLGYLVSLAVLHQAVREGFTSMTLLTDDWRRAAIITYLRLGFQPVVSDESHPERWIKVLEELNWPERFEPILNIRRGSERLTPFLEGVGRSSLKLPEAIPDGLQSMVNSPKLSIE